MRGGGREGGRGGRGRVRVGERMTHRGGGGGGDKQIASDGETQRGAGEKV